MVVLTSTSVPAASGEIVVFAATSLTDVMTALGAAFSKANPNAHLTFIFANSATLAGELDQGVKADVFASAHPATIARVGGIVGVIQTFAQTTLVILTPMENPARITSLLDLANPGVRIVASDPSDAVAKYTDLLFQKASVDPVYGSDFAARVQKNVVSQQTTQRDLLAAILAGKADAGIAYTSDLTPDRIGRLNAITVPDRLTTKVSDPIAVAKGDNPTGGQAFVKFVMSEPGQDVIAAQGFAKALPDNRVSQ